MNYFNVLSSNFTRESIAWYFKFKDFPIIGKTITNLLINRLYEAYEITTTLIESSEHAIHVFENSFPLHTEYLNYVLSEVKDNIDQAVNYVAQLENSYPKLIKVVHTVKASTTLLKHKKYLLK